MANLAEKKLNEAATGAEQAKTQWNNEATHMFDVSVLSLMIQVGHAIMH